ncbi:MAG: TldD/PmbA family protein [Oscillospiraceae bacterium]|nr:TldD/PmbA family protein [Oscillospiraceae bacterium]
MSFSEFLQSRRADARALVTELKKTYDYVSVLGVDVKARTVSANNRLTNIASGMDTECGFVVKVAGDGVFYEYSLDDIRGDLGVLVDEIHRSFRFSKALQLKPIGIHDLSDEPLVKSFCRESDLDRYSEEQLLDYCKELRDRINAKSENLLNTSVGIYTMETSKLFVSENRELDQSYAWVNGMVSVIWRENDQTVQFGSGENEPTIAAVLEKLPGVVEEVLHTAHMLTTAKPMVPGEYDIVTDTHMTGLICHEAFGHGVEMDMFVKDRALAKEYVGKYVASPIVNMKDGAASCVSAGSYFFDDEGVLAGDTQIIKDGILVTGISDLSSALELGTAPTGNGRRESSRRKAYARMTNTFIEPGKDRLEDMIASIDHGYYVCECDNGMEDPKNWAIQCVAKYAIEIKDGKLTDNWFSPVIISGYVPDLLKSISMVSSDCKIVGAGMCGKGYKEWVRVSDGGPCVKARAKLG